jgi:type IV pilus assembly protein PilW
MTQNHDKAIAQRGFTLIELMIAMVLTLFLSAGVISLFLASRQSFRADENVARASA